MSVFDVVVVAFFVFILGILAISANLLITAYDSKYPAQLKNQWYNSAIANGKTAILGFDYLSVFLFVSMVCASVIGAFFVKTHPVFFFFSLLLLIISLLFNAQLANVFLEFATSPVVNSYSASFPLLQGFWNNSGLIFAVAGILIIIITYAKFGGGDERP